MLRTLKDQGFELGIISNFDSRLFSVLRGLGIADLFDTVTISSLARAAKPSARIFHQALEKHAVDPDEALHVGDSERERNVAPEDGYPMLPEGDERCARCRFRRDCGRG